MSTVDIAECRRLLERHTTLTAAIKSGIIASSEVAAYASRMERLIVYLPMLLDEVGQLRTEVVELRALFDLQHTRMVEATNQWREESPEERALVSPDLGKLLTWLMRRADTARARANEAARLSAQARDQADDLRRKIADQAEQIANLERDRLDRDAWAVRVATEHNLFELLPDVEDEYAAIAARLRAYRAEMVIQVEFGDKAVAGREMALAEVAELRRTIRSLSPGQGDDDG